jgi:hypothetical protein
MSENEQSVNGQLEEQIGPRPADDLTAVREVVLRAHPDAVPELIAGTTIAEMLASVEPARAAYARIVASAQTDEVADVERPETPHVPAGDAPAYLVDPDQLPPVEKIRRGLARQRP